MRKQANKHIAQNMVLCCFVCRSSNPAKSNKCSSKDTAELVHMQPLLGGKLRLVWTVDVNRSTCRCRMSEQPHVDMYMCTRCNMRPRC